MNPSAYKRPKKPDYIHVKRRADKTVQSVEVPQLVAVDACTECHVTPADVAARMVRYLRLEGTERVLEPNAGTGNLIAALIAAGHPVELLAGVEQHHRLAETARARFGGQVAVTQMDFLDLYSGDTFDRVLMNPPFRAVKKHIGRAVQALNAGGVCVALVPAPFQWEGAEMLERLEPGIFSAAKVCTKLIRITKP